MSRGRASEQSVCVYEAVSVEKGARRPPQPAAIACAPGGRRRRRLAITAEVSCQRQCQMINVLPVAWCEEGQSFRSPLRKKSFSPLDPRDTINLEVGNAINHTGSAFSNVPQKFYHRVLTVCQAS